MNGQNPDKQSHEGSSASLRDSISELLGADLAAVNQRLHGQLQSSHPYMAEVLQHASQFRGKQIRPVLLLLCQQSLSKSSNDNAHTLAAVVEMIHTATLIHDDIIDEATTRRHLGTINSVWNRETGVLLGDYLFSRAFRLAASTGDAVACELIGRATDRTCAGELHQTATRREMSRSERDYFRVIRGKTGQLFGLSCRLGVRAAGADDSMQSQLETAGIELGMAFQIADDLLDLTGEQTETGKDSGNDLVNHRLTLPLLRAYEFAAPSHREELDEILAAADSRAENVSTNDVRQRLVQHLAIQQGIESARQTGEQLISRFTHRTRLLPESKARHLLDAIAAFAVRRNS